MGGKKKAHTILGIVGDSATGKTTLTAGIANILGPDRVTVICTDDYHRYDRKARAAGETKYPLSRMVRFAVDAITGFSVVPLMASMTIGWGMAVIGFAFALYSVVGWAFGHVLPGWTSLMAAIGILGGMQFLMLGVIGAYLGRLYDQSKDRPLFMIRDIVGGPAPDRGRRS